MRQALVRVGMLVLLPILHVLLLFQLIDVPPAGDGRAPWKLALATATVGAGYFAVANTGPMRRLLWLRLLVSLALSAASLLLALPVLDYLTR